MIPALALAMGLIWAAPAHADPAGAAATAAEDLRNAATALDAASGQRDRIAALTATIRAYEDGLGAFRDALRDAALEERAIRARLEAERDRIARLIGALQLAGRDPETTLLLHPAGATGTVRASMLLADTVPALRAEAEALRRELDDLRVLALLREDARDQLQAGLDGAQAARTALAEAIAERRPTPQEDTDSAALLALLNGADTLDAFAASLSSAEPAPGPAAEGDLWPLPVAATLLRSYNDAGPDGIARPGLTLATLPRQLVTAPTGGTVRYAGPFLDDGAVVILEPRDGVLLVLAGLSETYAAAEDVVAPGDPLGLTGGQSPRAQDILIESGRGSGQDRSETLYMELRNGDAPVDPADWFALAQE